MSVETFDADWLALREPADHRSRAHELVPPLRRWWKERSRSRVLDLGGGTGSNLRYLAPRLGGPQEWTIIDHDPELLSRIGGAPPGISVDSIQGDLQGEGLEAVGGAELVTASALLDLVSRAWLDRLADACVESGCGALLALTYDGTIRWHRGGVPDVDQEVVSRAVNEHQRRNKGLGPALGPAAGDAALDAFRLRGYETWLHRTPWTLDREDTELARRLVAGWAAAALDRRPDDGDRIHTWTRRVEQSIAGGDFGLTVGHVDLLALPADRVVERS